MIRNILGSTSRHSCLVSVKKISSHLICHLHVRPTEIVLLSVLSVKMSHAFCAIFAQSQNTTPCYSFHYLKAPNHHLSLTLSPLFHLSSPPIFSPLLPNPALFFQRHWVDMHKEAHASWYHHRLRIWSGLHAASRRSILDTRLEKVATGYISPRLPAHLLYMVGNIMGIWTLDLLCIHTFPHKSTQIPSLWSSFSPLPLFLALLSIHSSSPLFSFCLLYALCISCQGAASLRQMVAGQWQEGGSHRTPPQGGTC